MNGLLRKEFRDQRPFLVLGAVLLLLELVYALARRFDMEPLSGNFPAIGEAFAFVLFLIAFAMGSGLLVREIDDRTLHFLDGLPTTRLRVFGVKASVAGAVLLVYPAGCLVLMAIQHVLARASLDYTLHAELLWTSFAMICVVTAVGLTLGMLLGYLRNLCWLVLAVCAIALRFVSTEWPVLVVLNPVDLLDVRLIGTHWRLSTVAIATQLAFAIACLGLALTVFLTASGGRGRKLQLRLSRPLVSAVTTLATIGACIGAVGYYASTLRPSSEEASNGVGSDGARFARAAPGYARTTRYSFRYPSDRAERVRTLIESADRTFDKVAGLLEVDGGAVIDVDFSGSMDNTEGTAFHNRIRMHVRGDQALDTLAHETAHVLALRLAGGENERELSKMSVLNEGLAQWVENRVSGESGLSRVDRLQAAIVSRRHLVRPEQLADMEALERDADRNLQYPLGAALIDAFVTRYGSGAPKKLLLALGHPDFPRDLEGMELWLAAFQAAEFDLALVFDDYVRQLKLWESEFVAEIAALPRPRGSLVQTDSYVGVELRLDIDVPTSWELLVRFRPEEGSSLRDYFTEGADEKGIAWLSSEDVVNEQVCFQPGLRSRDVTIYESWVCLPLDSAVEIVDEVIEAESSDVP